MEALLFMLDVFLLILILVDVVRAGRDEDGKANFSLFAFSRSPLARTRKK